MFQRQPLRGQHSLERAFEAVREAMPVDVQITVHTMPFASRGIFNRLRNMLFAWQNRGDINHVAGDVHYIVLLLPKRGTVLTVADLVSLKRLTGLPRLVVEWCWYRLPVRRAAQVTAISDWTRAELIALLPFAASKTAVVGCPVSTDFVPSHRPTRERPIVLQVGTGPNKNLRRVSEAMAGIDAHLRIIGRIEDAHINHLLAHKIDFSHASGLSDEDMVGEYRNCDLVVFTSTYEGFGLPIVEAQASGRPAITSALASMPEVAGGAALLVDPFSVSDIRAAIKLILSDPEVYRSLVARGLDNVRRFSPTSIAAEYAALYRRLDGRADSA
jgi:glycosyltransferase involved in cell wall biosynthesis